MARRGRRQVKGREWRLRLPDSLCPTVLRFATPVSEAEARRQARSLLGQCRLPVGTVLTDTVAVPLPE